MKRFKVILIAAVLYVILKSIRYYWEYWFWADLMMICMSLFTIVLFVVLIVQVYYAAIKKYYVKSRVYSIAVLVFVLAINFIFPSGLINFERFEGKYALIAEFYGGDGYKETIKFFDTDKYIYENATVGFYKYQGSYTTKGDTFFLNYEPVRRINDYDFAVKGKEYGDSTIVLWYREESTGLPFTIVYSAKADIHP